MRAEPNKIQTIGKDAACELEKDRQEEFLIDALQGIQNQQGCEHTHDMRNLMDTDSLGDTIIHHFECKCGKSVEEIFTLSKTRIS